MRSFTPQQYVIRRLDSAMDDALRVRRIQSVRNLHRVAEQPL
jgi:hypothetical protein